MERYCKNNKPYIYAAFPQDRQEQVLPVLEAVSSGGAQFWYANDFSKREKRRLQGAFGVLLFVTVDFAASERFHKIVDTAVTYGQKILCVYLEEIPATPWSDMQLGSQQALFTKILDDGFVSALKEAFIFRDMTVTDAQKKFQRDRAITMVAVPVVAAAILFFTVVNPLLIAPAMATNSLAKQWGLTKEDLESVTELHILGNQAFDTFVHATYHDSARTMVHYDMKVDEHMESQEPIPVGTLTSEDLSILQYMTNLEILELEGQQITDFSPILGTHVGSLRLNCNPITSIEGIEQMDSLQDLILTDTDIMDVTPAFKVPNLKSLQIEKTHVTDLSGIETVKNLRELNIADTQIKKLPAFGALENFSLDLRQTPLRDLSCLANVKSLDFVSIDSINAEDAVPYIAGKPIREFNICGVTDLEDLYALNIVPGGHLGIANNYLTTLDGIEHFDGIGYLDIHHNSNGSRNYLTDLTAVLKLESLEGLCISSDMRQMAQEQLQGAHFKIDYADN